jgi:hypothetical protein
MVILSIHRIGHVKLCRLSHITYITYLQMYVGLVILDHIGNYVCRFCHIRSHRFGHFKLGQVSLGYVGLENSFFARLVKIK